MRLVNKFFFNIDDGKSFGNPHYCHVTLAWTFCSILFDSALSIMLARIGACCFRVFFL
jgi:hypothetical protein